VKLALPASLTLLLCYHLQSVLHCPQLRRWVYSYAGDVACMSADLVCCRVRIVYQQRRRACRLTGIDGRRSKDAQSHSACQQPRACAAVMVLLRWL
jgi:hypothetical protein